MYAAARADVDSALRGPASGATYFDLLASRFGRLHQSCTDIV